MRDADNCSVWSSAPLVSHSASLVSSQERNKFELLKEEKADMAAEYEERLGALDDAHVRALEDEEAAYQVVRSVGGSNWVRADSTRTPTTLSHASSSSYLLSVLQLWVCHRTRAELCSVVASFFLSQSPTCACETFFF